MTDGSGIAGGREQRREGFTLVELSLVLVIIGLLIGGILSAQSMIGTSRNQKIMKVAEQYLLAGRNFKTTYGSWPGDSRSFPCPGLGDGTVNYGTGGNSCTISGFSQYEGANFFVHLSMAKFISDNLTFNTSISDNVDNITNAGVNVPRGPEKNTIFVVKHLVAAWGPDPTNVNGFSWDPVVSSVQPLGTSFILYGSDPVTYSQRTLYTGNAATPQDIYYIDKKMDDGMPNTGNVIGVNGYFPTGMGNCTLKDPAESATYGRLFPTATYYIANRNTACAFGLKISD